MCLSNSKAVCVRKILKQCLHICVYKILKQYVSREYVLKFLSRFRSFLPAGHLELQLQAKVWHIVHPSVSLGWSKRIKVAPVLSSWAGIKTLMKDTLRRSCRSETCNIVDESHSLKESDLLGEEDGLQGKGVFVLLNLDGSLPFPGTSWNPSTTTRNSSSSVRNKKSGLLLLLIYSQIFSN